MSLQETKENLLAKFAEVRASLPGVLEAFDAADKELAAILGRELLGEADPAHVASVRAEADAAKRRVAATRAAEALLRDRIQEADKAIVAQERAEANDKAAMAAVALPEAVSRVQTLARALGRAVIEAAQLDACIRRDPFVRTGQALNETIGKPMDELAALGIEPITSGFRGLRFVAQGPRPLTFAELAALCGESAHPKKENDAQPR